MFTEINNFKSYEFKSISLSLFILSFVLSINLLADDTLIEKNAKVPGTQAISIDNYLVRSTTWESSTLDNSEVPLKIYHNAVQAPAEGFPVIMYCMNHGHKRIGQESDETILLDYILQDYIVITVDYGNDERAVSPAVNDELYALYEATFNNTLLKDLKLKPRQYCYYFLPAGYRVARDLCFWELDKHGTVTALDNLVSDWNSYIAGSVEGIETIKTPDKLKGPDGKPLDYKYEMDIIYPSQPKSSVPLVFRIATSHPRKPAGAMGKRRPQFMGFTLRGYSFACVEYIWNPLIMSYWEFLWHNNRQAYKRMEPNYSIANTQGLKYSTAAVRYMRANAEKYNIDVNYIGSAGHSKGQYPITRLSDPNHISTREYEGSEITSTFGPQPNPGYSSRISVGYQSMGSGLWKEQYVTSDYVPSLIVIGLKDQPGVVKQHFKFVKAFEEKKTINYMNIVMPDIGHTFAYGYDNTLGVDRTQLWYDFFDRYLKADEKLPPAILTLLPLNGSIVSSDATIEVHFAPEMDADSIIDGGVVLSRMKNSTPVEGKWAIICGGCKYTFIPASNLITDEEYRIVVNNKVRNKAGTFLNCERQHKFKVKDQK
jgi:hypothetical protein